MPFLAEYLVIEVDTNDCVGAKFLRTLFEFLHRHVAGSLQLALIGSRSGAHQIAEADAPFDVRVVVNCIACPPTEELNLKSKPRPVSMFKLRHLLVTSVSPRWSG